MKKKVEILKHPVVCITYEKIEPIPKCLKFNSDSMMGIIRDGDCIAMVCKEELKRKGLI